MNISKFPIDQPPLALLDASPYPQAASGALEIIWQSPSESLADEIGHKLLQAVERRSAKRVFFEGMGALRHAFIFPERMPLFISAINNTLRASDTTILYSTELPSLFIPDQIATDELSSIAENIILTHCVKLPENRDRTTRRSRIVERELLVLKVRDSDYDACPEIFHITDDGVCFGGSEKDDLRPKEVSGAGEGG